MDCAKISGITIELGKKEIELTPEQAEMLYKALDKMFGEKVVTREVHHHEYRPYYPWKWSLGNATWCASNSDGNLGGVYSSLRAAYDPDKQTLCISAK